MIQETSSHVSEGSVLRVRRNAGHFKFSGRFSGVVADMAWVIIKGPLSKTRGLCWTHFMKQESSQVILFLLVYDVPTHQIHEFVI